MYVCNQNYSYFCMYTKPIITLKIVCLQNINDSEKY